MAQWINYIELFPEAEQPVIQELKNIMESQFGFSQFEAFRTNFDTVPFNDFPTTEYSDNFFSALSSWLASQTQEIEDWTTFQSQFETKDLPYIDLIIAEYEGGGTTVAEFAEFENSTRSSTIRSIEGIMAAYKTTLFSYMEELPFPINISSQPSSQEIDWDSSHTLTITISGGGTVEYQWRKNGIPVSGANSNTLALQNVRTKNAGQYDCIITDEFGQAISTKASISVVSLSSEIYTVYGKVENQKEAPISGVTVKALDRKPGSNKILGTTTTNSAGAYHIEYLRSELMNQETLQANLVVQLFEEGATEANTSSELIESADKEQEINFTTDVFVETETEFSLIAAYITSKLDEGVLLEDLEIEDVKLLADKVFSVELINFYISSVQLQTNITSVTTESFYGLLKQGLSSSKEELTATSVVRIKDALLSASDNNTISSLTETEAQTIANNINGKAAEIILQTEQNPFKKAFEKVSLTEAKKLDLLQRYIDDPQGANDILAESTLSAAEVSDIQRVFAISGLDSSNAAMVDVLDEKVGTSGVATELTDLVTLDLTQWEALIDDEDEELLSIPLRFSGTDAEKKTAYAKELKDAIELRLPTKVLAHEMNIDASFNSDDFDQFFTDHPDFEFGTQQVAIYLEANPLETSSYVSTSEAQLKLESVQRLYHLVSSTDRFQTIKPLLEDGLSSSHKIVSLGEPNFVSAYGSTLGVDTARGIYQNAARMNGHLTEVLVAHTNTPGPLILSTQGDLGATGSIPGIPNLETIFGSLDYCECTHCRSVYSPAAYLVDLLNFLSPGPDSEEVDLKTELTNRRGEIEKLFLHCDNTNTPLPYIDIVNEILENHILVNYLDLDGNGDPTNQAISYQTEVESETLRATPQNTIERVYDETLQSAVHPIHLPYNLWFEQAKAYLKQSNVDLGELIAAAPIENTESISAAASLSISPDQLSIITTYPSVETVDELAKQLYDVTDLTDLAVSVSAFIKKAGVTYEELLELMDSKFVNPFRKVIYFPADGSCRLDRMTIGEPDTWVDFDPVSGFSSAELINLNRFVRLQKLTNWSVKDLDLIINSLNGGVLNNQTILNLFYATQLKDRFDIELEEMVTWWSDFDVATYIDQNLFDKLFQDTSVNAETTIIPEFESMSSFTGRSFLEDEIKPLVLGALNLSAFDLDVILSEGTVPNYANVENFSMLYRIASFTKALRVSMKDYFAQKAILETGGVKEIIESEIEPKASVDFIEALELLDAIPFSNEEVAYLKSGDNSDSLAPEEEKITAFLKQLRTDYHGVEIDFSETAKDLEQETSALIGDLIPTTETTILDDVISGTTSALYNPDPVVENEVSGFFEEAFSSMVSSSDDLNDFRVELNEVTSALSGEEAVKDETAQRKRIVYTFLQRYKHVTTDFKNATTEKLALFFDIPSDLVTELYKIKIPIFDLVAQESQLLSSDQVLLDLVFLNSKNEINPMAFVNQYKTFRRLAKAAIIAKALNTTAEELNYLIDKLPSTYLSMESLPVEGEPNSNFNALKPILSFRELDNSVFTADHTLLEFLNQQYDENPEATFNRSELLATATGWRASDIAVLIGSNGFDFEANPTVFEEVEWIKQLDQAITLMGKARLDASTLVNLQLEDPTAETAFAIRNFLSSGMNKKQWLKVATEIHDEIREQKRDAMLAFLISDNNNDFNSPSDVYDHFLIDTQMNSCQLTSRIKQAISAIQLYVQRIGLNFEGNLKLSADRTEEWNWRKNYRVWEANRKVFLYPENYTLPEVRVNKSKLYSDFEETLTQGEVTHNFAEKAYLIYLENFKKLTNLSVSQMVHDKDKDVLHVFAKSQSDPAQHYHRSLTKRSIWSAWEEIPVDINSEGLLPVIERGKLLLCWLDVREQQERAIPSSVNVASEKDSNDKLTGFYPVTAPPEPDMEIRLAWTEKLSEGWTAKALTKDFKIVLKSNAQNLTMVPMKNESNELYISLVSDWHGTEGGFKYYLGNFESIDSPTDFLAGSETEDSKFFLRTIRKDNGESLIDPVMSYADYLFDPNASSPRHDYSWRDSDARDRRRFNIGVLSSALGNGSIIYQYFVNALNRHVKFKDQKLTLPNMNRFDYTSKIYIGRFSGRKAIIFGNKKLLTATNGKSFTLIGPIDHYFPFLSRESALTDENETTPFFIIEGGKTYIINPQLLFDRITGSSINIIESNILRIYVQSRTDFSDLIY